MSSPLDETIRAIVREVVREEIRTALDRRPAPSLRNDAADAYLPISMAAKLAAVAPGTMRRWITAGRLPARRAGRVYRIARKELEAFLGHGDAHSCGADIAPASTRGAGGR